MTIIVFAEDKTGRVDHGNYTVPTIEQAFANFSYDDAETYFADADGETPLSLEEAKAIFEAEGSVTFYNNEGEMARFRRNRSL